MDVAFYLLDHDLSYDLSLCNYMLQDGHWRVLYGEYLNPIMFQKFDHSLDFFLQLKDI